MDYLVDHLETSISEAEEAAKKYIKAIEDCRSFIIEFATEEPKVSDIYRDWEVFYTKKLDYFQSNLKDLRRKLI